MDGNEFVTKLKVKNQALLAKIEEPPISSGIPKGELLSTVVKMAPPFKSPAERLCGRDSRLLDDCC
jgi:hypothetical protein